MEEGERGDEARRVNPDEWEKLEREVRMHESGFEAMHSRTIASDLLSLLEEQLVSRNDAWDMAVEALKRIEERGVVHAHGVWTDATLERAAGLEVDLRHLVGSSRYEPPPAAEKTRLYELLERIEELMKVVSPEEDQTPALGEYERAVGCLKEGSWSKKDVEQLIEALSTKLNLLEELRSLLTSLQTIGWKVSQLESRKEVLRVQEEDAHEDGEVARAVELLEERIEVEEEQLRRIREKLEVVERAVDECCQKRRSNVGRFRLGMSTLEALSEEKKRKMASAQLDADRVAAALLHEKGSREMQREEFERRWAMSAVALEENTTKREAATAQLRELLQKFGEVERDLGRLSHERRGLVDARLAKEERGRAADHEEFKALAEARGVMIQATKAEWERAAKSLLVVQSYLLGSKSFNDHDFYSTSRKLQGTRVIVAKQARELWSDVLSDAGCLRRRYEAQMRGCGETAQNEEVRQTLYSEELDPIARKYAMGKKREGDRMQSLMDSVGALDERMGAIEIECWEPAKKELLSAGIPTELAGTDPGWEGVSRREELLEMREALMPVPQEDLLTQKADTDGYRTLAEETRTQFRQELRRKIAGGQAGSLRPMLTVQEQEQAAVAKMAAQRESRPIAPPPVASAAVVLSASVMSALVDGDISLASAPPRISSRDSSGRGRREPRQIGSSFLPPV